MAFHCFYLLYPSQKFATKVVNPPSMLFFAKMVNLFPTMLLAMTLELFYSLCVFLNILGY